MHTGELALVPPTEIVELPTMTEKLVPCAAKSGYARPEVLERATINTTGKKVQARTTRTCTVQYICSQGMTHIQQQHQLDKMGCQSIGRNLHQKKILQLPVRRQWCPLQQLR